ncbi:MAG: hypothetical protein KK478_23850, partial [Ensifer alkalisoli]|nr:hypothetical protein [Sinorhizobium alkalisoli]
MLSTIQESVAADWQADQEDHQARHQDRYDRIRARLFSTGPPPATSCERAGLACAGLPARRSRSAAIAAVRLASFATAFCDDG